MWWVFQYNLYGYIFKLFGRIVEFLNCSNHFNHEVSYFAFLTFSNSVFYLGKFRPFTIVEKW
jgi:hypothetical protein